MRPGTRRHLPENMMDVAPKDGFKLQKKDVKIEVGDHIMTGNRPGEWLVVEKWHELAGYQADVLASEIGAQVKIARRSF